jgi:hypothetical protein
MSHLFAAPTAASPWWTWPGGGPGATRSGREVGRCSVARRVTQIWSTRRPREGSVPLCKRHRMTRGTPRSSRSLRACPAAASVSTPGLLVYLEALYVARQDVVHTDAIGRVAVGVELAEAGQGGAQRGGEGEGGGGLEGREGGDVDNGAALPEHRGRHQAGDAHDVQHHQVEGLVPLPVRQLQDLPRGGVPRAVDDRVDAAVPLDGAADEGLEVGLLRDRAREADSPSSLARASALPEVDISATA